MKTYTATFHTDAEFATRDFEAETPEQALALAQKLYADELHTDGPSRLWFEPYIDMTVNEIAVCDADGNELAAWYDDDMRLRLAAHDLLEALRFCDMTLADLEASKRKGYIQEEIRLPRAALAKAKGGAA
jgi:hypothetical protein